MTFLAWLSANPILGIISFVLIVQAITTIIETCKSSTTDS